MDHKDPKPKQIATIAMPPNEVPVILHASLPEDGYGSFRASDLTMRLNAQYAEPLVRQHLAHELVHMFFELFPASLDDVDEEMVARALARPLYTFLEHNTNFYKKRKGWQL